MLPSLSFSPPTLTPLFPFILFSPDVRFRDVARGGIRIVRSRGKEQYSINSRNLFDENYALASTQALKNKDIPEGGAKGTILPSLGANPRACFEAYVDAISDLLLPGQTPGIKGPIVDLYGQTEILFFGPDEGTADMMDWAAEHARSRGAPWWKSFTTGKSANKLGGIPHDTYGMTSLSVRQYIKGGSLLLPFALFFCNLPADKSLPLRHLREARLEGIRGHQVPDWWPRRRPWLERDPPFERQDGRHHRW